MTFILLICLTAFMSNVSAQSGKDIMQKYYEQQTSNSEYVELKMTLMNNKGKARVRQVEWYSITDKNDERSSLIRFTYPADVKGTGYLELENSMNDKNAWLFLPALKKSKRISVADESDNFMSTEFTYEDLAREEIGEFSYSLKEESVINGIPCYRILAIPSSENKKQNSGYGKRELYISKENYVALKIDFYDKNNQLTKQLIASEIKSVSGSNKVRAHILEMKNLKRNYSTKLEFENFIINKGLDSELFTLRYLEKS